MEDKWNAAQKWEKNWWINNTKAQHKYECQKGDNIAKLMILSEGNIKDKSVIDIGCGPFSLLLRNTVKKGVGLDPIDYGDLESEYIDKGIKRLVKKGEDLNIEDGLYDEAWIYNCLQHVHDPKQIILNAMTVAKTVRIFEWTYYPVNIGHLHLLTPEGLSKPFEDAKWHTLYSSSGVINHYGLRGKIFVGIFCKEKRDSI